MHQDLEKIFNYHPPKGDQASRYETLRVAGLEFAKLIRDLTPRSAEQTLAIRDVQRAVMMANAAIAINESEPSVYLTRDPNGLG